MRMRLSEGFAICASAPRRATARIKKTASAALHDFVVRKLLMTLLPHPSDRCITNKTLLSEVCDSAPNRQVHEFCSQPDRVACVCANCANSDPDGPALRPRALP